MDKIFKIKTKKEFNILCIDIFHHQYKNNKIYHNFVDELNVDVNKIKEYTEILFLPINFFKTHIIKSTEDEAQKIFLSSSTTGLNQSKHYINDIEVYNKSFLETFRIFYGEPADYCILALLPSYLEREGSSLIFMMDRLIKESKNSKSGFYLNEHKKLAETLETLKKEKQKIFLLGVSFGLLDFIENYTVKIPDAIVMETGGMKGRRNEMIRDELHFLLKKSFGVKTIHSEYGMTELLSQAYSFGNGIFNTPPWMKILIRDINDPLCLIDKNKTGGINIIDLANYNSCSFIATQDLGKINDDNSFEIIGRFDDSDIRGCNLLIS